MSDLIKAMRVLAEMSNEVHQDIESLVDESVYRDKSVITSRMAAREIFAYFGEMLEKAAYRLERESKEPVTEEIGDGWIVWNGGDCPVNESFFVDLRFKDGSERRNDRAGNWHWHHEKSYVDSKKEIIAYRVLKP